jgi:hypothetical protein
MESTWSSCTPCGKARTAGTGAALIQQLRRCNIRAHPIRSPIPRGLCRGWAVFLSGRFTRGSLCAGTARLPFITARVCSGIIIVLLRSGHRAHGARLAIRSLHWLFRDHVVFLFRLAPTVRGRRSHHGRCGPARRSASVYAGSFSQCCGGTVRRGRSTGGGSRCGVFHSGMEDRIPTLFEVPNE